MFRRCGRRAWILWRRCGTNRCAGAKRRKEGERRKRGKGNAEAQSTPKKSGFLATLGMTLFGMRGDRARGGGAAVGVRAVVARAAFSRVRVTIPFANIQCLIQLLCRWGERSSRLCLLTAHAATCALRRRHF